MASRTVYAAVAVGLALIFTSALVREMRRDRESTECESGDSVACGRICIEGNTLGCDRIEERCRNEDAMACATMKEVARLRAEGRSRF